MSVPGPASSVRRVLFARTRRERTRGLRGSPSPQALLLRAKQIHTFGMKFPIDAVFVSRHLCVLRVVTMPPRRISPVVLRASWVLELPAGEANKMMLQPGATVSLVQVT